MNRRQFTTALGLALATVAAPDLAAQKTKPRKLRCGHTGITWGFRPEDAERAIADVASLGYHGYERGNPKAGSTSCWRARSCRCARPTARST